MRNFLSKQYWQWSYLTPWRCCTVLALLTMRLQSYLFLAFSFHSSHLLSQILLYVLFSYLSWPSSLPFSSYSRSLSVHKSLLDPILTHYLIIVNPPQPWRCYEPNNIFSTNYLIIYVLIVLRYSKLSISSYCFSLGLVDQLRGHWWGGSKYIWMLLKLYLNTKLKMSCKHT